MKLEQDHAIIRRHSFKFGFNRRNMTQIIDGSKISHEIISFSWSPIVIYDTTTAKPIRMRQHHACCIAKDGEFYRISLCLYSLIHLSQ